MTDLTITRVFDAPRELVFDAWTTPEHLAGWYGPVGLTTPLSSISLDVRPGGTWRATMISDADGTEYPQGGTYQEVVAPERLVFTWGAPDDPARQALVTVTLAEADGKTTMTFLISSLPQDMRESVHEGWTSALESLATYLEPT
ncbi:SRPBCC domain-containing protein [Kibdelosporangium philippinense]|uniref:SRPBCC domain-containing protein n=1 Tax=Kibdelosporangium philippinense TaxID=211113 RepID=A0ABS8ZB75_9PSEU|nr:SRPBCC domain-containing protein [Kibdelosporangium philippinense]MCE7005131.1 SRPBCC domain-containing protein [Kibdelosporangium philippinense]